jgi:hypothetical protein
MAKRGAVFSRSRSTKLKPTSPSHETLEPINMKQLFTIYLFLFCLTGIGQTQYKSYNNNENYLKFLSNGRVTFYLHADGGLVSWIAGEGSYALKNNRITIHVDTHDKDLESAHKVMFDSAIDKGYKVKLSTKDEHGQIVPYVYLTYINNKKEILSFPSDSNGILQLVIPEKPSSLIEVTLVGYTSAYLPYKEGRSLFYEVSLKENSVRFLDEKTLIMDITLNDSEKTFEYKIRKIKQ